MSLRGPSIHSSSPHPYGRTRNKELRGKKYSNPSFLPGLSATVDLHQPITMHEARERLFLCATARTFLLWRSILWLKLPRSRLATCHAIHGLFRGIEHRPKSHLPLNNWRSHQVTTSFKRRDWKSSPHISFVPSSLRSGI